jgi:hypothetical protein
MLISTPGCRLIIIGNCPYLEGVIYPARLWCYLGVVSIMKMLSVLSFLDSKVDARENGSE